jgi:hypothetical protein
MSADSVAAHRSPDEFWSGSMQEADEKDRQDWLRASPQERMEALEYIRALNYGYAEEDQPRPEFQRVYRSAELGKS